MDRYKDKFEELSDEMLVDWYEKFQPGGSGPLGVMFYICVLIEEIAEKRGLQLPPASRSDLNRFK